MGPLLNRVLDASEAAWLLLLLAGDQLASHALERLRGALQEQGADAAYGMLVNPQGLLTSALPFEADRLMRLDYLATLGPVKTSVAREPRWLVGRSQHRRRRALGSVAASGGFGRVGLFGAPTVSSSGVLPESLALLLRPRSGPCWPVAWERDRDAPACLRGR